MSLQWLWGAGAPTNPTLKGHQLLVIAVAPPAPEWVAKVKAKYADLDVVHVNKNPWSLLVRRSNRPLRPKPSSASSASSSSTLSIITDDDDEDVDIADDIDWSKATVLLTGPLVPAVGQAPNLQLVQLQSAGANYLLDNPLFKDTDVAFSTANGVHGPQITEWVISTYLTIQHHLPRYLENMKDGLWEKPTDNNGVVDAVGGRVGILGYGSIGRQVGRVAKALGMDVIAYTNGRRSTPESRRDTGYIVPGTGDPEGTFPSRWLSGADNQFDEFLSANLDLLVVAVPLTASTKGLIGAREFQLLAKRRTFLSNIARGPIVDTDALVAALDDGLIRGAALDVTDPEPLPSDHQLWHKPNVIITPHISSNSTEYNRRVLDIVELNLQKLSEGSTDFVNKVNKKQGY